MRIRHHQSGLTIIEMMIILAIGSIIVIGIMISAQGLNKSVRNSARDADVESMITFFGDYRTKKLKYPSGSLSVEHVNANQIFVIDSLKSPKMKHYNATDLSWLLMIKGISVWSVSFQYNAQTHKLNFMSPSDDFFDNGAHVRDGMLVFFERKCQLESKETGNPSSLLKDNPASFAIVYAKEGSDYFFCRDST